MSYNAKDVRKYIVIAVLAIFLACFIFILYVTFECPYDRLSDCGKRNVCRHKIRQLLSVTNLFATAQQAADELRTWKDPWGNFYNVLVADEFANARFRNLTGRNLIMWSSGPNGINENGQGDDILDGEESCWEKKCNGDVP